MNQNDKIEYQHFKKEEKKKCLFCGENAAGQLILLIILLLAAFIVYKYLYKSNTFKENGIEYTLTKKIFTKTPSFEFKIKNTTENNVTIKYEDMIFEIINARNNIVYFQSITMKNQEIKSKNEYIEDIEINEKLKFGKYTAVVFLDTNAMKKRAYISFDVR